MPKTGNSNGWIKRWKLWNILSVYKAESGLATWLSLLFMCNPHTCKRKRHRIQKATDFSLVIVLKANVGGCPGVFTASLNSCIAGELGPSGRCLGAPLLDCLHPFPSPSWLLSDAGIITPVLFEFPPYLWARVSWRKKQNNLHMDSAVAAGNARRYEFRGNSRRGVRDLPGSIKFAPNRSERR